MNVQNKHSLRSSLKGYSVKIIVSLFFCLTIFEVNTKVCQQLCLKDGFDNGLYSEKLKQCFCLESKEILKEKRIKLSSKYKKEGYDYFEK